MFNNLIESQPVKTKTFGASMVSTIFHVAVIGASIFATANAGMEQEEEVVQAVDFVDVKTDEPPSRNHSASQ